MARASLDAAKQVVPLFLTGVNVNQIATSNPHNHTDTMSLGEPPPQSQQLIQEVSRYFSSRLRLYFWEIPVVTFLHIGIYSAIFALPEYFVGRWRFWESEFWATYILQVYVHIPLVPELIKTIKPEMFYEGVVLVFVFYILNALDVFWWIHTRLLIVPTWIRYRPLSSRYEKLLSVDGASLHFGLLKVWYGYNDDAFFVRSLADHAAMVVDFSIINSVRVDEKIGDNRWRGNYNTPPVRIEFDSGRNRAILRIHGGYFEQNGNGLAKANDFVVGLRAAMQKRNPNIAEAGG